MKLREQGTESRSSTPLPAISSSVENTRQNGSNDSDRYSDNEEGKILYDVNKVYNQKNQIFFRPIRYSNHEEDKILNNITKIYVNFVHIIRVVLQVI